MWSMISRVGEILGLSPAEPQVDLEEIYSVLDSPDVFEGDEEEAMPWEGEGDEGGVACQHRVGVVTALFENHGFVTTDDKEVFFRRQDGPPRLRQGDRVLYLAYKMSEDSEWVVRKILNVENENWEGSENGDDINTPFVKEECQVAYKSVIAKVSGRQGRTVLADNLQFCLDSVQISFIPVVGDWLVLQSLVQTQSDEPLSSSADTILNVSRVVPVRERQAEGVVSHWNTDTRQGILNQEVVFTKDACEPGYIPREGDEVAMYCIESEQNQYTWRAVHVVPTVPRAATNTNDSQNTLELLLNKHGIVISEDTNCGMLDVGQEADIAIQIKNVSTETRRLEAVEFSSQQTQFQLSEPPTFEPMDIVPDQTVHFVFKVNARFVGCTTELVVFQFSGFVIGRQLVVDVMTPELVASLTANRSRSGPRTRNQPIKADKLLTSRAGFIVAGVRPIKPASFVPVALGMFGLPKKLVQLTLTPNQRREDVIRRLVDEYPYLEGPLDPKNYVLRWHLLIHLEEIEQSVNISHYNTQASMHRLQDYLCLAIPGLSEKRPSLIVGDKVIAREAWTDENSPDHDVQTVGYEGYIHKVLGNEILMKFNPSFHDSCVGIYSITFESSRTQFRREHQAIHVANKNLTTDWLFPSQVVLQPPQILITEEEYYLPDDKNINLSLHNKIHHGYSGINTIAKVVGNSEHNAVTENETKKVDNCLPAIDNNIEANTKTKAHNDSFGNVDFIQKEQGTANIVKAEQEQDNGNKNRCSNQEVKGRRRKISDRFEQSLIKEESLHKPPSPRVPVVERFLKNGNRPSSEDNSKDVKSMLQQLSSLSTNKNLSTEKHPMKTLEQIEQQILKTNVNISDEQLSEVKNLPLTETSPVTPFHKFLSENNINDKIDNAVNSYKEETNGNILDNAFTESKRATTPQRKGPTENKDRVEWNSRYEMKAGYEKEANSNIPSRKRRILKWFNPLLNHYQKEAVRNILKGEARPLPYVIFGPPGTGKTITLVEAILQIYFLIPESRLLIGTPSNSSADLVCERLLDCDLLQPGDLLRLVGYHYGEQGRVPERLRPYCGTADIKAREDRTNPIPSSETKIEGVVNLSRHAIGRHRVTVGTCNALGVLYQMGFPKGHFTHVLIDEAGQAKEPEILIPIVFLHKSYGQVVLAGDPLQLGPVVLSKVADYFGMGESFLGRLLTTVPYSRDPVGYPTTGGYNPLLVTRLLYNYRSLPGILDLPNTMFYDGDLIPQVCKSSSEEAQMLSSLVSVLPNGAGPVVFHGVRGINCQTPDSPSWYNPHEVVLAANYLQALYSAGLTPDHCGIITPYQAQVLKIRHMLEALEMELPKIGSVEEFQGQERMVIILSAVRSSPKLLETDLRHTVGFVASPRRLNVSITRARTALIIVGNPHLLARDQYWRSVLEYCVSHGSYIGCDLPQLNVNSVKTPTS